MLISLGIYKIGSKSADDAKAIGKYDIEDLQRQERYNYTDSDEDEKKRKKDLRNFFEHEPYAGRQGLGAGYDNGD